MTASDHPLRPTDTWVRLLFVPLLAFLTTITDRNYQTDIWHHLARGRVLAEEGVLLNEDRFTYTVPGLQFQDVNWLAQYGFYQLYRLGGLPLVQTVNSLLLALTLFLLLLQCRRSARASGHADLIAAGVGLFVFFGLWQLLIIRPQTFSLLLFVVLQGVLERAEERPAWLFAPPLILALWVNLHGGFPVGLVLIGAHLLAALVKGFVQQGRAGWRDRRVWLLAGCLGAAVLGTLVNPYGWRVYEYVGLTSGRAAGRRIDEWLPPGLNTITGKVWAASLVALLVLFALPGRRPTVREVCVLACFLPASCGSVRMAAWWMVVVAPVLAGLLTANLPRREEKPAEVSLGPALVCVVFLVLAVFCTPWFERVNPLQYAGRGTHRTEDDLQAIADRLAEEPELRVFTRFEWGEYFTWALGPRNAIFLDARIEIYPDEVWDQYSAITRGRADWHNILAEYKVNWLVLDRTEYHGELWPRVTESGAWETVLERGKAVLLKRK
jgi:hypothetical protein